MKRIYCVVYLVVGMLVVGNALAGITVIPNVITMTAADLPRTDVVVTNEDAEEAYVKITPHIVADPGTTHERKIIIRNPLQHGLLVSPQQLIIPPKQRRLVRIMLTKPCDNQERIYRIDIVPVARDIIPRKTASTARKNMGLQMLVGYGVLAIVRPIKPLLNVAILRKDKQLFLKNNGNANVELSNIEQCNSSHCYTVQNFIRLYAGNNRKIPLKFRVPVKMVAQLQDTQKILTSN